MELNIPDVDTETLMNVADMLSVELAQMATKSVNDLPDSDFAYIEPGGEKDEEGKTMPRSLRHLPIHDAAHVRNALARLNQTDISAGAKAAALRKIKAAAKKHGVEVGEHMDMADNDKPNTEALDQKGIMDILNEIKVKLTGDTETADMTEPLKAIELAIQKQQADFAAKQAEEEKKRLAIESAMESQKLEFAKTKEMLDAIVEAEKAQRRKAEIASIEAMLAKVAYPPQLEVMKKFALEPASGEKVYKFTDEKGEARNVSLLEALVEFAMAAPKGSRPDDLAEEVTTFKATEPSDVDAVKLRLTAYESAKKQQGLSGDDLKKAVESYKASLVSPN